jgi:hypothetical protein
MKCYFCKALYWLAHRFCPDMVWNQAMSLEMDRLLEERDEHTIL